MGSSYLGIHLYVLSAILYSVNPGKFPLLQAGNPTGAQHCRGNLALGLVQLQKLFGALIEPILQNIAVLHQRFFIQSPNDSGCGSAKVCSHRGAYLSLITSIFRRVMRSSYKYLS